MWSGEVWLIDCVKGKYVCSESAYDMQCVDLYGPIPIEMHVMHGM